MRRLLPCALTNTCSRSELSGFTTLLESFEQQQPDAVLGRRRLSPIMVGRWKMWAAKGTAQSFCEAWVKAPPETLSRATACLEYIQVTPAVLCCPGGFALCGCTKRVPCVCVSRAPLHQGM
jgi:hypothetical protein